MKPAKFNPARGELPVLQYCAPEQLKIDPDYQRSLENGKSEALIRRIAINWDWGLCQPLFVARRSDGGLFVVDGQHRLAAARMRGDIWQLPCVVSAFSTASAEAEAFVQLNQQRCPLSALQLFKASLASGDEEARKIAAALERGGLTLAGSTNNRDIPPGAVSNIAGLRSCLRGFGEKVLELACVALAAAYPGQVLRYAGSIFPGIAAVVGDEERKLAGASREFAAELGAFVGSVAQSEWYRRITLALADEPSLTRALIAAKTVRRSWAEHQRNDSDSAGGAIAEPVPLATFLKPEERAWCTQCESRRDGVSTALCKDRFCKLKVRPEGLSGGQAPKDEAA